MIYKGIAGHIYDTQNSPFASGGEGDVFEIISNKNIVAKIYKPEKRTTERERKLAAMISSVPSINQYSWPNDVLYDNGKFMGFTMPKIAGKNKLRNVYVYDKRSDKIWSFFIAIARNLSSAIYHVHEIDQIIGDLNPENILVDSTGIVTLVDTDSYHIKDRFGIIYRCNVGMPEFIAPELQGLHFPSAPLPTFTQEADLFSLAVLIFELLMNGAHPFACKTTSGSSSKFQPIDNLINGVCPYFKDTKANNIEIPRYAPDISMLPSDIQVLFHRAFIDGHKMPNLRPTAEEWYNALGVLETGLKKCKVNLKHEYYSQVHVCPWCSVEKKMNFVNSSPGISQQPFHTGLNTYKPGSKNKPNAQSIPPARKTKQKKKGAKTTAAIILSTIMLIISALIIAYINSNHELSYQTNIYDYDDTKSEETIGAEQDEIINDYSLDDFITSLNSVYIDEQSLSGFSREEITYIRNGLYALSGYIFISTEYKDYFESFRWYNPQYTSMTEAAKHFNYYQVHNLNTITKYESDKGWN